MPLGGDATAALHALLGAIDAGDAPAARGELATLLVALGQVAAAAGVMGGERGFTVGTPTETAT